MKIELRDLHHVYPTGEAALRGVTLAIEGADPIAVIGQNGAGKTTLVKHLNGLLKPTAGEVYIDGENIKNRSTASWSKKIGYVFQNPDNQLFLESVKKELEFGPKQIGMTRTAIADNLQRISELVGLADKLEVHPFDLNTTEKKFCTIGAVLMMQPEVVIFDEPTCGQDVAGNQRLKQIIQALKEQNILCITISHDMKFVVENFNRILVMCKGQVILDDVKEVVFSEVDTLSQSFVAPPPITRVAQQAGFDKTVFTTEAFMKVFEERGK